MSGSYFAMTGTGNNNNSSSTSMSNDTKILSKNNISSMNHISGQKQAYLNLHPQSLHNSSSLGQTNLLPSTSSCISSVNHTNQPVSTLFESRRKSEKQTERDGLRFGESMKSAGQKEQQIQAASIFRGIVSRQGSYEVRQTVNLMENQQTEDSTIRNSFLSQKHACSAKQLTCHSPNSRGIFFPKSDLIPKTFQKKLNEGKMWLGPTSNISGICKNPSSYVSPASKTSNSHIGLLGQNKNRIKLGQNSPHQISVSSQQLYLNNTLENDSKYDQNDCGMTITTDNNDIEQQFPEEKQTNNNEYFVSQTGKKTRNPMDEGNFMKQTCSNRNNTINSQNLSHNSTIQSHPQNTIDIMEETSKEIEEQKSKPINPYLQTSQHFQVKNQQPFNLLHTMQNNDLSQTNKSKNLQELLRSTEQQLINTTTTATTSAGVKKNLNSNKLHDLFLDKKQLFLSQNHDPQQLSPSQHQNQYQNQQLFNSLSSPNQHIHKNLLVSPDSQSSKLPSDNYHSGLSQHTITEQQSLLKKNPLMQSYNSHNIYALQDSYFSPQNLTQEKEDKEIIYKEPYIDSRSSFKKHSHNQQALLPGSIVNIKKTKKKRDDQQIILLTQKLEVSAADNLHSKYIEKQPQEYFHSQQSKQQDTKPNEINDYLRLEVENLRNNNAMLTQKAETLEKEKKHFKDLALRKTAECEHLTEQLNLLRVQLDNLKASRINSHSSQESTSATSKPIPHTLLLSAHNVSTQLLDTPRQSAVPPAVHPSHFLLSSSTNHNNIATTNGQNPPQIYQNNNGHFNQVNWKQQYCQSQQDQLTQKQQQSMQQPYANIQHHSSYRYPDESQQQLGQVFQQQQQQQQYQLEQLRYFQPSISHQHLQQQQPSQCIEQSRSIQQSQIIYNSLEIKKDHKGEWQLQQYQHHNNHDEQSQTLATPPSHKNNYSLPPTVNQFVYSPSNCTQLGTIQINGGQQSYSKQHNLSPIGNSQEHSEFISNSILDDIPSAYSQQLNNSSIIQANNPSQQHNNQVQQHSLELHNLQQINYPQGQH